MISMWSKKPSPFFFYVIFKDKCCSKSPSHHSITHIQGIFYFIANKHKAHFVSLQERIDHKESTRKFFWKPTGGTKSPYLIYFHRFQCVSSGGGHVAPKVRHCSLESYRSQQGGGVRLRRLQYETKQAFCMGKRHSHSFAVSLQAASKCSTFGAWDMNTTSLSFHSSQQQSRRTSLGTPGGASVGTPHGAVEVHSSCTTAIMSGFHLILIQKARANGHWEIMWSVSSTVSPQGHSSCQAKNLTFGWV